MSDESRNVLVVTFEHAAESVKVCVYICVCVCVCGLVWLYVCGCRCGCGCGYAERVESLCSCLVQCHVWEAVKGFG